MNYLMEPARQRKKDRKSISVRLAIRGGLEHLHDTGNRLTGGGLRSLAKRQLRLLRFAGDRLTGGGLHGLAKRTLTKSLRRAMSHPFLKVLGGSLLQPFPSFSARLYRLATAPDTVFTATNLPLLGDHIGDAELREALARLENAAATHVEADEFDVALRLIHVQAEELWLRTQPRGWDIR